MAASSAPHGYGLFLYFPEMMRGLGFNGETSWDHLPDTKFLRRCASASAMRGGIG
jgi:hypothetical protein